MQPDDHYSKSGFESFLWHIYSLKTFGPDAPTLQWVSSTFFKCFAQCLESMFWRCDMNLRPSIDDWVVHPLFWTKKLFSSIRGWDLITYFTPFFLRYHHQSTALMKLKVIFQMCLNVFNCFLQKVSGFLTSFIVFIISKTLLSYCRFNIYLEQNYQITSCTMVRKDIGQ